MLRLGDTTGEAACLSSTASEAEAWPLAMVLDSVFWSDRVHEVSVKVKAKSDRSLFIVCLLL